MTYSIIKRTCVHDSGTKYYTAYEIIGPKGCAVAFAYGKYSVGATIEPRHHGQLAVDLFPNKSGGVAATAASRKINAKRKRGYTTWEKTSFDAMGEGEFSTRVWGIFPDKSARNILNAAILGKHSGEMDEEEPAMKEWEKDDIVFSEDIASRAPIRVEKPIAPPVSVDLNDWGTW
jgi:predicted DNA-binding WGR domain protein